MKKEIDVLRNFLNMSIFSTDEVFDAFKTDTAGQMYEIDGNRFYFKNGTRKDKILLVAHADTVWDNRYGRFELFDKDKNFKGEPRRIQSPKLAEDTFKFYSGSKDYGIGADDRAGAAICWLLKDSGNSVLITDQEEIGAFSARSIMDDENFKEIINSHRYMLQFDLQGKKLYKCYSAGSIDFKAMVDMKTGYNMLPNFSFTDIAVLGRNICGANLSTGYKYEHTPFEIVSKREWLRTYRIAKKLCNAKHQQFNVDPEFGYQSMRSEDKINFEKKDDYIIDFDLDEMKDIEKYFNSKDEKFIDYNKEDIPETEREM